MESLKARGIRAFLWDLASKIGIKGTGLIISVFLARLLEPSEFGLVAMVAVIIGISQIFMDVGLGGALIQRKRLHPAHYASVFYFNVFVALLLSLGTFFSAPYISAFYRNETLVPLVEVMSVSFVITALSSVQRTRLRRELDYAALAKISFFSSLTSGVIGVILAVYGAGVWSLVAQTLSAGVITNMMIWTMSGWKPSCPFSVKALLQLWEFGFRMFISKLIDAVFTRLDFIIIGKLFPPATLGFYERAKSLNSIAVQFSSGSLMTVLFPLLSKVQYNLPRLQHIVIKTLAITSFVLFLILGGLFVVSEELIVILFSDKWLPSVAYFQILVLSGFGYPISALFLNVLSSRGNSRAFLRLEIYQKSLLGINLYVGFLYGIEGYLYGLIAVSALGVALSILFVSREIGLPYFTFIRPVMVQMLIAVTSVSVTLSSVGPTALPDVAALFAKGLLFTAVYFLISLLFRTRSYLHFSEEVFPLIRQVIQLGKVTR
jgi:O-antigen/teichoic acid export membrane protein